MTSVIQELNSELARLSKQVHASLVRVESGRGGAGAGTIWHSEGLILTNSHVARSRRVSVTLPDGRRAPARLLARSRDLDLAALTVELSDLPTMEIGDSGTLQPGHWVMAFGHPWGVEGAAPPASLSGRAQNCPIDQPLGATGWQLACTTGPDILADRWSILLAVWWVSTPSWWAQMWGLRCRCTKSSASSNTP